MINEFTLQRFSSDKEQDPLQLKIKEVMEWPWHNFEWLPIYRIRYEEETS